ncbi:hypothetical protein [Oceanobacillus halophilus]|uniref:Uncharacterized protein n=1 Tax=Oceanobacillus halophilus TaxID=930130 RepID=A0A494ZXL1_9BACI|nr:hypothetical protein [Oceanobacillus halophilus]RKQ30794.1 hypothetical protein D8M06_15360 [Oceanobacillus halophilus]
MRKYSVYLLLGFILLSWGLGIYYVAAFYTPTTVIPMFNNFYWTSTYSAMLGLTTAFTITSILLFVIHKFYKKIYKWYLVRGIGLFAWGFVIFSQLKIAAFNLGICH